LASDKGTGVAAIVIVRTIDFAGLDLDQCPSGSTGYDHDAGHPPLHQVREAREPIKCAMGRGTPTAPTIAAAIRSKARPGAKSW
jgi:hypothetical protein